MSWGFLSILVFSSQCQREHRDVSEFEFDLDAVVIGECDFFVECLDIDGWFVVHQARVMDRTLFVEGFGDEDMVDRL